MSAQEVATTTPEVVGEAEAIPFREFLENVHPSSQRAITGMWKREIGTVLKSIIAPDLRIHCPSPTCGGVRTFRHVGDTPSARDAKAEVFLL